MKKQLSRMVCLGLVLVMLVTPFASCKKEETSESETTTVATTEPEYYLHTLPNNKYDYPDATIISIDTNCVTDEFLDRKDAVDVKKFERDIIIKEYFGIDMNYFKLEGSYDSERTAFMQTAITAGECNWDIIIASAQTLMSLTINGATKKLNTIENIALDNIWWCQSMNNNVRFNDAQYVACGPVAEWFYGAALALAYNIDMAEASGMPNIYDLVFDGKWTLEEMRKLCSDYSIADVEQDKYAVSFASGVGPYGLFASAGCNFSSFNEQGEIIVDIGSEKAVNALEAILKAFDPLKNFYGPVADCANKFTQEKALFYYTSVGWMEEYLPSSEVRYGIIPCPKMDVSDSYVSCAWPGSAFATGIPQTVSDEREGFVGLVLEAYCFLGYDIMKPVKYDSIVKYRVATDEISSKALDVIFDNLYFDLNLVMNLGGSRDLINNAILNGMGRYTTGVLTIEPKIKGDIAAYDALTKS